MAFDVQEWLDNYNKDEILFLFKGEITGTLITDSLDKIESKTEDASNKAKKKIYNVLVECMQNLFHHSSVLPTDGSTKEQGKYGICLLSKNSVGYHITTGNFIQKKHKDFLSKHLSHINSLDKDELKDLYKDILNNQEFSEKGGGGLGMVDISRKSGSKLDYKFHDYHKGYYFFSLNIKIVE
ncbi:MAG: SiaB family protein kinase [Salinivirgaceae bacterium]|jgi:transposase-like protein|nr:SiaB family protein kinase [Salinivirgaceae bacterium]